MKGLPAPDKPYELDGYEKTATMRKFLKRGFNTMINASGRLEATRAIRKNYVDDKWRAKNRGEPFEPLNDEKELLKDEIIGVVITKFEQKHEPIAEYFLSGYGNNLQWIDSWAAEKIMLTFALEGFPCLPVHDSFIVDIELKDKLESLMETVFSQYGRIDQEFPVSERIDEDYIDYRWELVFKSAYNYISNDSKTRDEKEAMLQKVLETVNKTIEIWTR